MLTKKELGNTLEDLMVSESVTFLQEVPYAAHLTDKDQRLDDDYYIRHRIETVKRIQMTAKSDALALYHMVGENYDAAREWSKYITEELDHDRIFIKDLGVHGIGPDRIAQTRPFRSTNAMVDYLVEKIHWHGSLPAVAYSIYVEWNSNLYSRKTVEKARKQYSFSHTKGAFEHSRIDDTLNHYDVMVNIAWLLVKEKDRVGDLLHCLRDIGRYFRLYFLELYEECISNRSVHAVPLVLAAPAAVPAGPAVPAAISAVPAVPAASAVN